MIEGSRSSVSGGPGLVAANLPLVAIQDAVQDTVAVHDAVTGKRITVFPRVDLRKNLKTSEDSFRFLVLFPDAKHLLVLAEAIDGAEVIALFDIATKQRLRQFGAKKGYHFSSLLLVDDGKTLVAVEGSWDTGKEQLVSWDLASGQRLKTVELAASYFKFQMLPNGKAMVITSREAAEVSTAGSEGLWLIDTATGKEIRSFHEADMNSSAFAISPDSKILFTSAPGKLQAWDIATGKRGAVYRSQWLDPAESYQPAVSPDGKYLVGLARYTWTAWDLGTGKELHKLAGHRGPVGAVAFAPDGKTLVTSGCDSTRLWDVTNGKQKHPLTEKVEYFPFPVLRQNAFSGDGKLVAAIGPYHGLHLWNTASGERLPDWEGMKGGRPMAFVPQSDVLAVAGAQGLRLWHTATGKPAYRRLRRAIPAARITALTFSPDGQRLAAVVQRGDTEGQRVCEIGLWHTATGKKNGALAFNPAPAAGWAATDLGEMFSHKSGDGRWPVALLFSPDGKQLAVATLHAVHLFDVATGKELRLFAGPSVFGGGAAFAPDGKVLATGTFDGTIRLWEVATGTVLCDIPGHDLLVSSVAFSPHGKLLASASLDSTVLLWKVQDLLQPAAAKPSAKELEQLWTDLGAADAEQADRAMTKLVAAPAEATALLKSSLQPVPAPDPLLVAKLVEGLNSPKFAERDQATAKLAQLAELARPALEQRLAAKPSLEMRLRMEALLSKLDGPLTRPEVLRGLRAVEVLERLGTPAARQILEAIARGAPAAWLTQDAQAALERLCSSEV
jgi:WD40 repeat protein